MVLSLIALQTYQTGEDKQIYKINHGIQTTMPTVAREKEPKV
jgi:hypothetical protein